MLADRERKDVFAERTPCNKIRKWAIIVYIFKSDYSLLNFRVHAKSHEAALTYLVMPHLKEKVKSGRTRWTRAGNDKTAAGGIYDNELRLRGR